MIVKYIKTFTIPNQWRLNNKEGGFSNEILIMNRKTTE